MQIYLVGGAVRDLIMGIHSQDLDYVVVNSSVEEMLNLRFIPVGQNFPVFLHPVTKQEYALARTEKKISKGYKGFSFFAHKSVTLQEDLSRRDLTINAMALPIHAKCEDKFDLSQLIDPFNGLQDINNKILRHVSHAFLEDPVRILRIARFKARYNFEIHETTLLLMKKMVENNEIQALVAERVWQETSKALIENYPVKFFYALQQINSVEIIFPELVYNFEINMLNLEQLNSQDLATNFTILMLNLDKNAILSFCQRLKVKKNLEEMAISTKLTLDKLKSMPSIHCGTDILDIINIADGFRRKDRFIKILEICEQYYIINQLPYNFDKSIIIQHLKNCLQIDIKNLIDTNKTSKLSIKEQVYQSRLKIINKN